MRTSVSVIVKRRLQQTSVICCSAIFLLFPYVNKVSFGHSLLLNRGMSSKRSFLDASKKSFTESKSDDEDVKPRRKRIAQSPDDIPALALATYNIWFGKTGFENQRMEAIIDALRPHAPNLIGFQEVTASLASIIFPLLESLGYHTIVQPFSSYGCAIACKVDQIIDSGYHPFSNSKMDRGIVWALIRQNNRELLFTTTHLESYLDASDNGGPEREVQLLEIAEFCERCIRERSTVDLAIVTGDLNWDDERPRSVGDNRKLISLLDETKWFDAYRHVNSKETGYTYDPKVNPMLGGGSVRRRFDRILIHSHDLQKVNVSRIDIVGKDALPGLKYVVPPTRFHGPKTRLVAPSDHFGLVSSITFSE
jgi:tyrosyl-DNA phosphodiesterase 2